MQCLTMDGVFGNPASRSHLFGWQAEEKVECARGQLADLINADPREIVWTSGATESNNLALKGIAQARELYGKHIVTSAIEHKAVLDACAFLESQGFEVSYLNPGKHGLIEVAQLRSILRDDTVLVSLMHVNNELGTVTDIAQIGALCRERGVAFHVDCAQSAGKLPVDVKRQNIDLLSISAHKMYGPKGIGALYVRRSPEIQIQAQLHGGGHERGMRSGTLATHQIAGFGAAAQLAQSDMEQVGTQIKKLRDRFWQGIADLPNVRINGSQEQRIFTHLNVCFGDIDGEMLLIELRDLAVSTGSACTSASVEPSYVLKALGLSNRNALSSIRFSFGRYTREQDIDFAIQKVRSVVLGLQNQVFASASSRVS